MTTEEAKKFGLQLLHGIMERNESYPVYANNVKQAIDALSEESSSSEIPNDLEEAAEKSASQYYVDGGYSPFQNVETAAHEAGFIAGAKWQKKLDDLETADLLTIAHLQGMEQQKAKMLEEAVEGKVFMSFAPGHNQVVMADVDLPTNTKVKVIIVKEELK